VNCHCLKFIGMLGLTQDINGVRLNILIFEPASAIDYMILWPSDVEPENREVIQPVC